MAPSKVAKRPTAAPARAKRGVGKPKPTSRREHLLGQGAVPSVLRASDVELMLAQAKENPFSSPEWLFELKYDGFRLLGEKGSGKARLRYRHGADATAAFPEVADAMASLQVEHAVLDGELVIFQADGRPSFGALGDRFTLSRPSAVARAALERPATLLAFDCLALDGLDLRPLPLLERKNVLRELIPVSPALRFADHVEGQGEAFFEKVRAMGLEGIVAKKLESPYRAGRSDDWQKMKIDRTGDFVVVGFSLPQGSREGIGGLDLAQFRNGELVYAGSVGTGFSARDLLTIRAALDTVQRSEAPFSGQIPPGKPHVWVEPKLVAEVKYKERRKDGLRLPTFVRFRLDKRPAECLEPEERVDPAGGRRRAWRRQH